MDLSQIDLFSCIPYTKPKDALPLKTLPDEHFMDEEEFFEDDIWGEENFTKDGVPKISTETFKKFYKKSLVPTESKNLRKNQNINHSKKDLLIRNHFEKYVKYKRIFKLFCQALRDYTDLNAKTIKLKELIESNTGEVGEMDFDDFLYKHVERNVIIKQIKNVFYFKDGDHWNNCLKIINKLVENINTL